MYSKSALQRLTAYITGLDGIKDKSKLAEMVKKEFELTTDRKIYYNDQFAIRFSQSTKKKMGNTVLSLSALLKYDDRPVIDCIVTPDKNYQILMNTTFLKKISHSSQELRIDNIRGSFNGSDIEDVIDGIDNEPQNFERLFAYHTGIAKDENLERLVESTNGIQGRVHKFDVNQGAYNGIISSINRAAKFLNSDCYNDLQVDLNNRVRISQNEIAIASLIENVNIRGRVIEFLVTDNGSYLKDKIIEALSNGEAIPEFSTKDGLGDYSKQYADYCTETDIKTKIMYLNSNPKAFNIDKLLEFLSRDKSVYMVYLIGITNNKDIVCRLVSAFDTRLMDSTRVIHHWAGRDSRGVAQFEGAGLANILNDEEHSEFSELKAVEFVKRLIAM